MTTELNPQSTGLNKLTVARYKAGGEVAIRLDTPKGMVALKMAGGMLVSYEHGRPLPLNSEILDLVKYAITNATARLVETASGNVQGEGWTYVGCLDDATGTYTRQLAEPQAYTITFGREDM